MYNSGGSGPIFKGGGRGVLICKHVLVCLMSMVCGTISYICISSDGGTLSGGKNNIRIMKYDFLVSTEQHLLWVFKKY